MNDRSLTSPATVIWDATVDRYVYFISPRKEKSHSAMYELTTGDGTISRQDSVYTQFGLSFNGLLFYYDKERWRF